MVLASCEKYETCVVFFFHPIHLKCLSYCGYRQITWLRAVHMQNTKSSIGVVLVLVVVCGSA